MRWLLGLNVIILLTLIAGFFILLVNVGIVNDNLHLIYSTCASGEDA